MKLKLTLLRAHGPESDVVVTTDASASVGDVAATLAERDPYRAKLGLAVSGVPTVAIVDTASGRRRTLDREMAISEAELGSGATVVLTSPGDVEPQKRAAAVTLHVVEGPDAGAVFPLHIGTHVLGRDTNTDVTLSDPLVSKRHARVDVFSQAVRLVDLNSANGLEVDGGVVTRVDLEDGSTVRVGDTLLQAHITPTTETVEADFSAPVAFNRSPRVESRYPGQEFVAPSPPTEQESQPFPWVILLAPVLIGGIMVLLLPERGLQMLIFVAAAPLLMIGTWLTTRAQRKRKHKLDVERFEARAAQLESALTAEVPRERDVRRRESPTTLEVVEQSMQLGPLLWTRRPEHWQFLSLNLGIGTMASRNSVRISNEDTGIAEYLDRVKRTRADFRDISDVPVTENLYFSGALGIAGEHRLAADCARGLLVQLAGLHSPAELVIGAIVGTAWTPEFEWLKWLPHTGSPHSPLAAVHLANSQATGGALLSAIEDLIVARKLSPEVRGAVMEERSALVAGASAGDGADVATPPPAATPAVVVLIAEDAPVDRARLVQMAERAADAGIYPIWVASQLSSIPAVARTFITPLSDDSASVGLVRLGSEIVNVRSDLVSRDEALRFARRLAPVVDAGALVEDASDLPRSTMLLSLIGPELAASPETAVGRWRENDSIHDRSGKAPARRRAGKLRAIVGSAGVDAMHLDLRTQGPHALVGGTTGSGKSEFLQAWVLGMAAEYSPDRVTFLFVDYKGGSAFADCVNLPHCVGLVTDLSPHLVRRALTSLRAELHHREHLFNRKKAKDLLELEKRGDPEAPPALVIVIDEFAALASEVPEFVDGVVDVAQRGRSLGIHLIMATQRPAGVIKDNLRANTNLRIALRMADESDSMDVVGDKIAGTFDPSIPGRGIAKTGPGRLTPFQSAYAGGWTSDTPAPPSIDVAELRFGTEQAWERPGTDAEPTAEASEQGPTDQARLVANLVAAAKSVPLPAPRRPWLDELAPAYDLTKLRQRTDTEIVLGVSDLPQRQQQNEIYFRPDTDGNIVVYGAGGTGKTVTLRSIAAAAGITPRGGPVDVYGLDFGTGGLKMLEALPHVGSIVSGDDPERVVRLLRKLKGILEDRGNRFAEADAGTIVDYRRLAGAADERRILLLVDNFPSFRNDFEVGAARAPWYAAFQQLLVEGRGLGIHVAMTADRPGSVPTGIASAFQRRVVHRLADDGGYMMVDAPADILSTTSPPGRAIVDGVETQIAIVGGKPSTADQAKALTVLGQAIERAGRTPAEPIGALAVQYSASELPPSINGLPVLGIAEDTLAPIGFEASGAFVLAGAPASGRSNALAWFVRSIESAIPSVTRYYIGSARSSLGQSAGWEATAVTIDDAGALAKEIAAVVADPATTGKVVVVIEQLADFLSSSADGAMVEMIKAVKRTEHFVLAESETGGWGSSWPLLAEVKAARTGFLLQPESIEGDTILKTSLPRVSRAEFPPGRGYFIARGKAMRVQLPWLGE